MKIFNTLTRRKEEFVPLEEGKVKMYVCGPTVYNLIHIGNARPMIIFDTVRRYMEYKGYEVNYVSNFTDVDDKIIKKAIEEGVSAEEISTRYIKECKKDMADMNVKPATTAPQATQEIQGMIDMIQTLIDKGYAYPAADGTVYFRVKKFKEYGKLVEINESSFACKRSPRRNVVELLKLCKKYEVPVVFDSDCHFCQLIGQTPKVAKIAEELDFPEKLIMNSDWEKIREYVLAKRPNLDI